MSPSSSKTYTQTPQFHCSCPIAIITFLTFPNSCPAYKLPLENSSLSSTQCKPIFTSFGTSLSQFSAPWLDVVLYSWNVHLADRKSIFTSFSFAACSFLHRSHWTPHWNAPHINMSMPGNWQIVGQTYYRKLPQSSKRSIHLIPRICTSHLLVIDKPWNPSQTLLAGLRVWSMHATGRRVSC